MANSFNRAGVCAGSVRADLSTYDGGETPHDVRPRLFPLRGQLSATGTCLGCLLRDVLRDPSDESNAGSLSATFSSLRSAVAMTDLFGGLAGVKSG